MLNTVLRLSHNTNYKKGRSNGLNTIKYIVIHYTGNKGDLAINNGKYFQGAGRKASAHQFIDDTTRCKSVLDSDTAWSVGRDYSKGKAKYWKKCTNNNSINIEMCTKFKDKDHYISNDTVNNTIAITKLYMKAYGVPIENVIRHYDVCGKICPKPFVKNEELWVDFKRRLKE